MHGPVVTEFKCDDNFSLYSSGIMIQAEQSNYTNIRVAEQESLSQETDGDLIIPSKGNIEFVQ